MMGNMTKNIISRICLLAWTITALSPFPAAGEPVRLSIPLFGNLAEIEIHDLERAEAMEAATAAFAAMHRLDQLADPQGSLLGGVGALNAAQGQDSLAIDPALTEVLSRALQFCAWSGGAFGPLGGDLRQLWQSLDQESAAPDPHELRSAVIHADCRRLELETSREPPTASLIPGSRLDIRDSASGHAIDRAVEILRQRGVSNAWVGVGNVQRAFGAGPSGDGWLVTLPTPPTSNEPLDQLWLRNQAMAVVGQGENAAPPTPRIDQRTGVPARGVLTVVTVTELAIDAQTLAESLFIIGRREGQLRLGSLKPRPAVYWLLGEGRGQPLVSTYRWSDLALTRHR